MSRSIRFVHDMPRVVLGDRDDWREFAVECQVPKDALLAVVSGGRSDENIHKSPDTFVGQPVVVTEKLDGGNTLLHSGKAYGRSVATLQTANGWRWSRSIMRGR